MQQEKSKNQLYKESGSNLSFKDWIRQDLDKSVKAKTAAVVKQLQHGDGTVQGNTYLHVCGDPDKNYKPALTGKTILGLPKELVLGAGIIVIAFSVYKIYKITNSQ